MSTLIISAKNDKGEDLFDLALKGVKDVTRRKSPRRVGSVISLQRGRGIKGAAKATVVSCGMNWMWERYATDQEKQGDARREGNFSSYEALWEEIKRIYKGDVPPLYRIEFALVKGD